MNHISIASPSNLTLKIVEFGRLLKQQGLDITHARIYDVLKGCGYINIWNREEFYNLTKSNLVSRKEDLETFDEIFLLFWQEKMTIKTGEDHDAGPQTTSSRGKFEFVLPFLDDHDEEQSRKDHIPAADLYESFLKKDFSTLSAPELDRIRRIIAWAMRRLCLRLGRCFKVSNKIQKVDFRRSFRSSLKAGGELIDLKYRHKKPQKIRIVLLLDISGSMDVYSHFFFQFMYGLQQGLKDTESFVFSTRLNRITTFIQGRTLEQALYELGKLQLNWSGGTNIGASLEQFFREHIRSMSTRKILVLIASDGWDRGDPETLRAAMERIRSRAHRIFWLNPLLAGSHYKPLCLGIRTALPYVDYFLPFYNLNSILELGRVLEKTSAAAGFVNTEAKRWRYAGYEPSIRN